MNTNMVLFTVSELKIMTARHLLTEAGIESFVLDKKDSAHAGIFGDIQLYVGQDDFVKAKHILVKNEVIEE